MQVPRPAPESETLEVGPSDPQPMSLPGDSDAQQFETPGRNKGKMEETGSWSEGHGFLWGTEGKGEVWAALGPVTAGLPFCGASLASPSLSRAGFGPGRGKSGVGRSTVTGPAFRSAPGACAARGWQGRGAVGSRSEGKAKCCKFSGAFTGVGDPGKG